MPYMFATQDAFMQWASTLQADAPAVCSDQGVAFTIVQALAHLIHQVSTWNFTLEEHDPPLRWLIIAHCLLARLYDALVAGDLTPLTKESFNELPLAIARARRALPLCPARYRNPGKDDQRFSAARGSSSSGGFRGSSSSTPARKRSSGMWCKWHRMDTHDTDACRDRPSAPPAGRSADRDHSRNKRAKSEHQGERS
jgi:hypothetical protein